MNSFPKFQDTTERGRGAGKIAIWEPRVLLSHSFSSLLSMFSSKGRTSDAGVPPSKILRSPEGDPGADVEKGSEKDAEVRKAGNRSGSCRSGWTPVFLMRCASTFGFTSSLALALGGGGTFDCTTEFAVPPLAVLDLGERGRGENGKLAMSFDSSLHKSKYKKYQYSNHMW